MILLHISNFYIAFNWNPIIKKERMMMYRDSESVTVLDIWKFKICNFKIESYSLGDVNKN